MTKQSITIPPLVHIYLLGRCVQILLYLQLLLTVDFGVSFSISGFLSILTQEQALRVGLSSIFCWNKLGAECTGLALNLFLDLSHSLLHFISASCILDLVLEENVLALCNLSGPTISELCVLALKLSPLCCRSYFISFFRSESYDNL